MAAFGAGILCLIFITFAAAPSFAAVYTVGDTAGWALGVDYDTWASKNTFAVGDSLAFSYASSHTVAEVTSSDYSACSASNAINSDSTGATTIPLKTAGPHYFICGVSSHCSGGMKLTVNVTGAASTTPTAPAAGGADSPPSSTTTSPTTTTTPPAGTATGTRSGSLPSSSGTLSPLAAVIITWVAMIFKLVLS